MNYFVLYHDIVEYGMTWYGTISSYVGYDGYTGMLGWIALGWRNDINMRLHDTICHPPWSCEKRGKKEKKTIDGESGI